MSSRWKKETRQVRELTDGLSQNLLYCRNWNMLLHKAILKWNLRIIFNQKRHKLDGFIITKALCDMPLSHSNFSFRGLYSFVLLKREGSYTLPMPGVMRVLNNDPGPGPDPRDLVSMVIWLLTLLELAVDNQSSQTMGLLPPLAPADMWNRTTINDYLCDKAVPQCLNNEPL